MRSFVINGEAWRVEFVPPDSKCLVDRTNTLTLATTDPSVHKVYIASNLSTSMRNRVLLHELGHCTMFSYDLLPDIHRAVPPELWIDAEEWVCNFIADYGREIFSIAYRIMGEDAWMYVPRKLEKLIG